MKHVFSSSGLRWIGVSILLVAYILVSRGVSSGVGLVYNGLTLLGSGFMIVSSVMMKPKDWAVVIFNLFWVTLSLWTIASILF
jgi:hypothetical protein